MTARAVKKDAVQYDVPIVWQPTDATAGHVACTLRVRGEVCRTGMESPRVPN